MNSSSGGIYTVGSSVEPIWKCLEARKPAYVLFVVSTNSAKQIGDGILPRLSYSPQFDQILLRDEESLEKVYEDVKGGIATWLGFKQLDPENVYFNYTGGTKSMSAGLAMAAVEVLPSYVYVSGRRGEDGLGTVVSGTEEMLDGVNPWYRHAVREREQASLLYRQRLVEGAARLLREGAAKSASGSVGLELWAQFCDVLVYQQLFDFTKADAEYKRLRPRFESFLSGLGSIDLDWFRGQGAYLETLARQANSNFEGSRPDLLMEILLNAERCAESARLDDAVARLYRVVELFAQNALSQVVEGASLGKVRKSKVSESDWLRICEAMPSERSCTRADGDEEFLFALAKIYELLGAIGGEKYSHIHLVYQNELKKVLMSRNQSILAHGVQRMTREKYDLLLNAMTNSLGLRANAEHRWPGLEFSRL